MLTLPFMMLGFAKGILTMGFITPFCTTIWGNMELELFPSKSKITLWQTNMAMEHGLVVGVFLR